MQIQPLTSDRLEESINLVLKADLDTPEQVRHHLEETEKYYIAIKDNKVVGVIGWYQDTMDYATEAMGATFPGKNAYWIGFFAVDKEFQGKGIGAELLKAIEKIVQQKKQKELWVASVVPTKSYYGKHGFAEIHQGTIDGNVMVFMKKEFV